MTVGKAAYSPASGKIMLRSKGLVKLSSAIHKINQKESLNYWLLPLNFLMLN